MKIVERTLKGKYKISSPYGYRIHPITGVKTFHYGVDYYTYNVKLPIYALEDGVVITAKKTHTVDVGVGRYVIVNYPRIKRRAIYQHCDTVVVSANQKVTKDTILGYVGTTGASTGIHLHLGLSKINGTEFIVDAEAYDYTPKEEVVVEPVIEPIIEEAPSVEIKPVEEDLKQDNMNTQEVAETTAEVTKTDYVPFEIDTETNLKVFQKIIDFIIKVIKSIKKN